MLGDSNYSDKIPDAVDNFIQKQESPTACKQGD
jgi:hypothetical protein